MLPSPKSTPYQEAHMSTTSRPSLAEHIAVRRGVAVEWIERELEAEETINAALEALNRGIGTLSDVLPPQVELEVADALATVERVRSRVEGAAKRAGEALPATSVLPEAA